MNASMLFQKHSSHHPDIQNNFKAVVEKIQVWGALWPIFINNPSFTHHLSPSPPTEERDRDRPVTHMGVWQNKVFPAACLAAGAVFYFCSKCSLQMNVLVWVLKGKPISPTLNQFKGDKSSSFNLKILLLLSVSPPRLQCARPETAHGYKLPAFDRHADSQDVLLRQPGSGHVPVLAHWGPEDHVQPGNLWKPTGRF